MVLECNKSKTSTGGGGKSSRKASRETVDSAATAASVESSKWNLTGTSEFTDSVQHVVDGVGQLQRLDEFIARKIHQLGNQGGDADRVFLSALREFKGLYTLLLLLVFHDPRNAFHWFVEPEISCFFSSFRGLLIGFTLIVEP